MVIKRKHILSIGAYLLFGVFLLNSVPKAFLHHIFANHSHTYNDKSIKKEGVSISAKQHCDCEKYFTETIFTNDVVQPNFECIFNQTSIISIPVEATINTLTQRNLRGPPVAL